MLHHYYIINYIIAHTIIIVKYPKKYMILGKMSSKENIKEGLQSIISKFEDDKVKEDFQRFNKIVQFVYPDVDTSYNLKIMGGKAEISEERDLRPNVVITLNSDTFLAIIKKEVNALEAFAAGKIKFKGSMVDLLKLQKLL